MYWSFFAKYLFYFSTHNWHILQDSERNFVSTQGMSSSRRIIVYNFINISSKFLWKIIKNERNTRSLPKDVLRKPLCGSSMGFWMKRKHLRYIFFQISQWGKGTGLYLCKRFCISTLISYLTYFGSKIEFLFSIVCFKIKTYDKHRVKKCPNENF